MGPFHNERSPLFLSGSLQLHKRFLHHRGDLHGYRIKREFLIDSVGLIQGCLHMRADEVLAATTSSKTKLTAFIHITQKGIIRAMQLDLDMAGVNGTSVHVLRDKKYSQVSIHTHHPFLFTLSVLPHVPPKIAP
jgi:hypothetical protein